MNVLMSEKKNSGKLIIYRKRRFYGPIGSFMIVVTKRPSRIMGLRV